MTTTTTSSAPRTMKHEINRVTMPIRYEIHGHQAGYPSTSSRAPEACKTEAQARAHYAQVLKIVAPHAKGVRFDLVEVRTWAITALDFHEDGDGERTHHVERKRVIGRGRVA